MLGVFGSSCALAVGNHLDLEKESGHAVIEPDLILLNIVVCGNSDVAHNDLHYGVITGKIDLAADGPVLELIAGSFGSFGIVGSKNAAKCNLFGRNDGTVDSAYIGAGCGITLVFDRILPHIYNIVEIADAGERTDNVVEDDAVAVNDEGLRNVSAGIECFIENAVNPYIGIGIAVLLEELKSALPSAAIGFAYGSNNLYALIGVGGIVLIRFLEVGHFAYAGTAPGCPIVYEGELGILKAGGIPGFAVVIYDAESGDVITECAILGRIDPVGVSNDAEAADSEHDSKQY